VTVDPVQAGLVLEEYWHVPVLKTWALLFLSSENKIEIKQINSLYGPIQIKRIIPDGGLAQLPIENLEVSNASSSAA